MKLLEIIKVQETLSEERAREIVAPIFDALIYCHKLGLVHKDIKPEKICCSLHPIFILRS